jgi:S-adenosylmethionine:tRNA ribosyltransferase-isomerase
MSLDLKDYSYSLPEKLIANHPASKRDACKLLLLNKKNGFIAHHKFSDLKNILGSNDVLVLNQSKVFPARLYGQKKSGGKFEILLIRQLEKDTWMAISKPRLIVGQELLFKNKLEARVIESNKQNGQVVLKFNQKNASFFKTLEIIGHTPLPPYISSPEPEQNLRKDYQTVYANKIGSAAAPTAGLHFTKKLLSDLKKKGVQIEYLTLHVGLGTFQNLRPENISSKTLHQEFYEIDQDVASRLNLAKKEGKRIIAVGTTSVRTLESAANPFIVSGNNSTTIFIYPPYHFKFVDALITNFHLPESSLLMLVSAFAGRNKILKAYQQAVVSDYRFFSFGDAMFIY